MTEEKKRGSIPSWLRFVLSAGILVFLFTQVDLAKLGSMFLSADPVWIVIGVALILSEYGILSVWWTSMLGGKGYNVTIPSVLHISFVGDFIGLVMPSSLGSDFVKVIGLSKHISNSTEALSSLLVFRVINYGLMIVIALFTVWVFGSFFPDDPIMDVITWSLLICALLGALGLIFAKQGLRLTQMVAEKLGMARVHTKLNELYTAFGYFKRKRSEIAKAGFAAFLMQIERIVYMYVISLAMGMNVDPTAFFVFVPIVTALTMIPVTVAGIGVREGGYVLLFSYIGVSSGEALGMSLMGFALNMIPVALGGILYWVIGFPAPKALEELRAGKAVQ